MKKNVLVQTRVSAVVKGLPYVVQPTLQVFATRLPLSWIRFPIKLLYNDTYPALSTKINCASCRQLQVFLFYRP